MLKSRVRISFLLSLLFLSLLLRTTFTFAQTEEAPPAVEAAVLAQSNAPPAAAGSPQGGAAPEPALPIILTIQYGKDGVVQEYNVKTGQSIFVPIGTPNNPSQVMSVQEEKSTQAYQQQLGQVSGQIAAKINAIQRKQAEIDSEVYTVYRTPLGIEKQALEQDLNNLQLRRDQLNSQIVSRQGLKPVIQPQAPATSMPGLTVNASLKDGKVVLQVSYGQNQSQIQTTIKGPPDQWLQIFAAEKGKGQDIWAKVTPQVP